MQGHDERNGPAVIGAIADELQDRLAQEENTSGLEIPATEASDYSISEYSSNSGDEEDESGGGLIRRGTSLLVKFIMPRHHLRLFAMGGVVRPFRASRTVTRESRIRSLQQLSSVIPEVARPSWRLLFLAMACVGAILVVVLVVSACSWLLIVALAALPWADAEGNVAPVTYLGVFPAVFWATFVCAGMFACSARDEFACKRIAAVLHQQWLVIFVATYLAVIPHLVVIYAVGTRRSIHYQLTHVTCVAFMCMYIWGSNYMSVKEVLSSESYLAYRAKKEALALQNGQTLPKAPTLVWAASKSSVPAFLIMAVILVYLFAVKAIYQAIHSSWWRLSVYGFALVVVKSGCEALIVKMLEPLARLPAFCDSILFMYENAVSLQARLLLLEEPDPTSLFVVAVVSGGWEFFLRLCYAVWLRRSLRRAGVVVSETLRQYEADENFDEAGVAVRQAVRRAKTVQTQAQLACSDACGDMVIEYVGANVAMLLMVYFGESAVFNFDFSVTSTSLVVAALPAQHIPEVPGREDMQKYRSGEVFVDLMSTFCEMTSGMDVVAYIRTQLRWRAIAAKCVYAFADIILGIFGRLFSLSRLDDY